MGPLRAFPAADLPANERSPAQRALGAADLRAFAAAVGNREFGRLAREQPSLPVLARTPYWVEASHKRSLKVTGAEVHERVLPELGKANRIFTEAPVPQADKSAAEVDDTHGFADLYKARTTVGIEFTGDQKPKRMASHRNSRYRGEKFDHIGTSAPTVVLGADGEPQIIKTGRAAPPVIILGDLKGGIDTVEAAEGPEQLENYVKGFRLAAEEVNEWKGAKVWDPTIRTFRRGEIKVPDYFTPGRAHEQESVRLALVDTVTFEAPRVDVGWSARHGVRGKLYVFDHPTHAGVLVYVWAPDQEVALAQLPPYVAALGPEIEERLRQPLLRPPLARRVREALPRTHAWPRLTRRAIARQAQPDTDPFEQEYPKWQRAHVDISSRAEAAANDPGVHDAESAAAIDEANAALRRLGVPAPKVAEERLKGGRTVREIKFWAGGSGKLIGRFRRIFGGVFTKVAELYVKVRDRVGALLKPSGNEKSFGGGFPGAAFKAVYTVLKRAASYIVTKTAERLKTSLVEGTKTKLSSLIPGKVETLESKAKDVAELVEKLETGVVERIEGGVEDVVGAYRNVLEKIEHVREIVGEGLDFVNKVKWGARVVACLSPPAVGCLWILAQSALEKAAAWVIDACWFKRAITPLINKLDWVKHLPGELAEWVRKKIAGLLPVPLQDIFAKIDTSSVTVGEDDIGCDSDDDPERIALTAERRALFDLIETIGEERFDALVDAMMAAGVRFDRRLTAAEIYKAKDMAVSSRATAEQLRHYAKYYAPFTDKRKFGPLGEFLSGLVDIDTSSPPVFGDTEPGGDGDGTDGAGSTTIEAVPANGQAPSGTPTHYEFVGVGRFSRDLKKSDTATLDETVKVNGKTVRLPGVKMIVIERSTTPDGSTKIMLSPIKTMWFELPKTPGLPTIISLSSTSTVWRTFPATGAAEKPAASAVQPQPADTEREPAHAGTAS